MTRSPIVLAALIAAAPAFAQSGPRSGAPPGPPTTAPAPGAPNAIPERIEPAPSAGDRTASGIPRSGVITPPAVAPMPQADVPAERPNSTPVIPPPGTPGGNPSVQPR